MTLARFLPSCVDLVQEHLTNECPTRLLNSGFRITAESKLTDAQKPYIYAELIGPCGVVGKPMAYAVDEARVTGDPDGYLASIVRIFVGNFASSMLAEHVLMTVHAKWRKPRR